MRALLLALLVWAGWADADTANESLKALAMQHNGREFCAPDFATLDDLQAAIDRYNRAHLELMGLLSDEQIIGALATAYPCSGKMAERLEPISPAQLDALLHKGQDAYSITPIFHQLLMMRWPQEFAPQPAYEHSEHGNYLRLSLLHGESLQSWTQMLTITGSEDQAKMPALSLQALIDFGAQRYSSQCPGSYAMSVLPQEGASPGQLYAILQSCGHSPDAPQYSISSLILALKGSDDIYTLRWDERAPAYEHPKPPDTQLWLHRLSELMPVRLCPLQAHEKAPYPSCLGKVH